MRPFFSEVRFLLSRLKAKDSFVRNFAVTFSWNTIATIVGFLFTPFVARLYTPEAYGLFAIFVSLAQNISLLATLQLTRAFTLAGSESELQALFRVTILCVVSTIAIVFVACLLCKDWILDFFNVAPVGSFLYLLPVVSFFYALVDVFRSWNVRYKYFQRNAVNQVVASVAARLLAILYALLMPAKNVGLIVGDLISKFIETIHLGSSGALMQVKHNFINHGFGIGLRGVLTQFKNYPLFVLPSSLVTLVTTQIPLFFVTKFYDSDSAGQYSLANSMLNIPVAVLAGAIAPVFLQRVSDAYRECRDQVHLLVNQVADKLFYFGIIPILILTIYGDLIFKVVFGSMWTQAGVLAGYMGFYFLFTVINSPLLSIYRIFKRERHLLYSTLIQAIVNVAALSIGYKIFATINGSILLFSISNVAFYLANIAVIFWIVGIKSFRLIIYWIFVAISLYGLISMSRIVFEKVAASMAIYL